MAPNTGDAEVVAHDRDAGFPEIADDGLNRCDLFVPSGTVQEDVVPVGGTEVLQCRQFQALGLNAPPQAGERLDGPGFEIRIGPAPAIVLLGGNARAVAEIVGQVGHDVGGACLSGETEIVRMQHVAVKTKAQFHCGVATFVNVFGGERRGQDGNCSDRSPRSVRSPVSRESHVDKIPAEDVHIASTFGF